MNHNPFPMVRRFEWIVVEVRPEVPMGKYEHTLAFDHGRVDDNEEELQRAAVDRCMNHVWQWYNALPAGQYRADFAILYEDEYGVEEWKKLTNTNSEEEETHLRLLSSPMAHDQWQRLSDYLDEWCRDYEGRLRPLTLAMTVLSQADVELVDERIVKAEEDKRRDKEAKKFMKRMKEREGGFTNSGRMARIGKSAKQSLGAGSSRDSLHRAVAMGLWPDVQKAQAHSKELKEAAAKLAAEAARGQGGERGDDKEELGRLEAAHGAAIDVYDRQGELWRASPVEGAKHRIALLRGCRYEKQEHADYFGVITDLAAFTGRYAGVACDHCHAAFADATHLAEHRKTQACLVCGDCGAGFKGETFAEGAAALAAHKVEAAYVPCEKKTEGPCEGRIRCKALAGRNDAYIVYDYETVPDAAERVEVLPEGGVKRVGGAQTPKQICWWISPKLAELAEGPFT